MDAKHLFRFRSQSCVFKFIRQSVDEALRVYVLRCLISLNVSISVHLPKSLCAQVSDFANRLEYLFHYQRVYVLRCLISLIVLVVSVPLPKSLCAQMSDFAILLLKWSTIGLGFDGAETNCRIAHILEYPTDDQVYWFHFYFSDIIVCPVPKSLNVFRCLISLIAWISTPLAKSLCAQVSDFASRPEYLFPCQRVYVIRRLVALIVWVSVPLPKSLCAPAVLWTASRSHSNQT